MTRRTRCNGEREHRTSLMVFRQRFKYDQQGNLVDISGMFTKECLADWLQSRTRLIPTAVETPTKSFIRFRRAITSHLSGTDGRSPFEPEEEAAVLDYIRTTDPWIAFEEWCTGTRQIKSRTKGYHELLAAPSVKDEAETFEKVEIPAPPPRGSVKDTALGRLPSKRLLNQAQSNRMNKLQRPDSTDSYSWSSSSSASSSATDQDYETLMASAFFSVVSAMQPTVMPLDLTFGPASFLDENDLNLFGSFN